MKPLPWSHSSLTAFNNCPLQYHEVKVVKRFKDAPNEASIWGDRVHKAMEAYLREGVPLEPEFAIYQGYVDNIKALPGTMDVELQMGLDTNMRPCDWYAPNVWARAIIDVLHRNNGVAWALDHKTGKRKPDSKQLMLFALFVFAHYSDIHTVHTRFTWLKEFAQDSAVYKREQEADLWRQFLPELAKYSAAFKFEDFPPKKSGLCNGWCPVVDCEFWKPKRN